MKSFLLLLLFTVLTTYCFAQKQNIYFLKDNGKEVSIRDSADFIRVIQEPDSGSINFKVLEYYPNETQKAIGEVSVFEPRLIYEGSCINYNEDGKKIRQITYQKGAPMGTAYYFYPSGNVMKRVEYGNEGMEVWLDSYRTKYKMIEYFDSTGVQTVKGGTGYSKEFTNDYKSLEEGNFMNGVKVGLWKILDLDKNMSWEETFNEGNFVSGVAISSDGLRSDYKKIEELPEFIGGLKEWSRYLNSNLRYPKDARKNNMKGRVILSFVIDKEGQLIDIKLLRGVYPSIDAEAERVLKGSPKWQPGRQRGIPVRVAYTMPISFDLSR